MAKVTVSTTGLGRRSYGDVSPPQECHKVEDIEYVRYVAGSDDRNVAILTLDVPQALGLAYDLLYQAVDAGALVGWNVQHPEREDAVA